MEAEQQHNQFAETNKKLTHKQVVAVTDEFMNTLVQDVDANYKVTNYKTKKALLTAFEEVTIRDIATDYIDYYYDEKADGLYIVPTETPPWFMKENPYTRKQTDKNKAQVKQTNNAYMYGTYTIILNFSYGSDWKITNITIQ